MADAVDSPEVPPSDDRLIRAWSKFRSSLHESGYRFNSRYAQQKYDGAKADPQEIIEYLGTMYERTAAMAVKTVTDHESAVGCCTQLDIFLKKMLNVSSKLIREVLPQESRGMCKTLSSELRRRLLPRSEHWKAEAHRLARKMQRIRSSSRGKKQTRLGDTQTPASGEECTAVAVRIMQAAMQQQGLNPPKLALKILAILRRAMQSKAKVDRTTVYRIVGGKTKKPQPAIRNALIEALQLKEEDATIVRRELGAVELTFPRDSRKGLTPAKRRP
jgi:hypothetical protein